MHIEVLALPTAAVRDEGTSYHYVPAGREVQPSPDALAALRAVLVKHGVQYIEGKTWTTDAIYRETAAKVVSPARVELEGEHARTRFDEVLGDRAGAGADVEDEVTRLDVRMRDEASRPVVSEAVPTPPGRPRFRGHDAP